jgi:hypothetical protein
MADASVYTGSMDAQMVDGAQRPRWQKLPETPQLDVSLTDRISVLMGDRITVLTNTNDATISRKVSWSYRFEQNDWVRVCQGPWNAASSDTCAVWTGTRLFYFIGSIGGLPQKNGGLYDPVTDIWSPISLEGAPALVVEGSAYTGQEAFLRGHVYTDDFHQVLVYGVLYNPSTDRWREASPPGVPTGLYASVIGVGSKIVVWGGFPKDADGNWGTVFGNGAVYHTITDSWTPMATQNAPGARARMIAFAARNQAFLWGGTDYTWDSLGNLTAFRDGAMYDPTRDLWTPVSTANSPVNAVDGLWAEEQGLAYVWVGQDSPGVTLWTYNPATDTWAAFDIADLPPLIQVSFHWTGSKLLAIGFIESGTPEDAAGAGLRLTGYLLNP